MQGVPRKRSGTAPDPVFINFGYQNCPNPTLDYKVRNVVPQLTPWVLKIYFGLHFVIITNNIINNIISDMTSTPKIRNTGAAVLRLACSIIGL